MSPGPLRTLASSLYGRLLWHATAHRGVPWHLRSGETCRIDPRCRWIRHPDYEAGVVEYLRRRVGPGTCCIDVGAHVGFYAVQMALWSGASGRVIAFEPNPHARRLLESNIRLNGLADRVRIEPHAVSDEAGPQTLFGADDASGLSRLHGFNPQHPSIGVATVDAIRLDAYCAAHALSPGCVLVDVEGAEASVLRGALDVLKSRVPTIVVEIHPSLWSRASIADELRGLASSSGRQIVPLTGQRDPLVEYGTVALELDPVVA